MKKEPKNNLILCADIGGSHVTAAIIDMDKKLVLSETRTRTVVDCLGSAQQILSTWAAGFEEVRKKTTYPIERLAIAMPGPFDYDTGVSLITGLQKYESLYGINVKEYLADVLHLDAENIRFRNDAEAFLQGEVTAGAGSGGTKVIGFTLGTGMGSAISINGNTRDANWGSVPFRESIADDYFSTRWFLKYYTLISGLKCSNVQELAVLALTDLQAASVFGTFAKNFAGFIQVYMKEEKPEILVLGGNIAKAHHLFLKQLKEHLIPYINPDQCLIAVLDEDAALIGAAADFN